MRSTFAAILLTTVTLCGTACSGSTAPAASPLTHLETKPPDEARVGDASRCPVSGQTFVIAADSPKVEYEGKTYYFCCADCVTKFQANPRQYLDRAGGAPRTAP